MPRLFTYTDFAKGSDKVKAYADKHTPVIICDNEAERDKLFSVKVRLGTSTKHPNTAEHHFEFIQLWNLETLIGEIKLQRSSYGKDPLQIEAVFSFVPRVSQRLTALAYCNKHGLWKSEEIFIKVYDKD
jgi:superoxide reductase